ncbi:hypothetical protein DBR32_14430 [Taibaiella sp. KBW10]|uniref:PIG-L family deacetylase n=1 Tax=Taibaiella sp. KBW10 TaxID=2153357 RepID=UPI000F590CA0|nr:PIG-L family deacetylase [Taibaiella sp. KBW10]RQO29778.1 hypothetical protein DBR32_14430 [Taibaiella sp. KBW10]
MKRILFLISILYGNIISAQQYRPGSSSTIYQELQQLQRLGTVMYIAAHPDDENTRLIAYLVHHDHVKTIYLSLTRGDGGQNILGNEQGPALGLIRTNEMMQARKIDGASQLFTRFVDFGFTKSPKETFAFWNQKQVVEDVKNAIQQYRPDVLICRFPTTGEGGHGQHTASAIAAKQAFEELQASKDPAVWVPKRILFNAFRFGSSNTIKDGQFLLPINQYDPLLGEGYGEMAGRSRSEHKSQGAGTPQSYGIANENFELMAGAPMSQSIYDGIDTSWNRVGREAIGIFIQNVIGKFDFSRPQNSIPELLNIKKMIQQLDKQNQFWINTKSAEIDHIILQCAGIQAEALSTQAATTIGDSLAISLNIIARASGIQLTGIQDASGKTYTPAALQLPNDSTVTTVFKLPVYTKTAVTEPFWMRSEVQNNQFVYPAPYHNEPLTHNAFSVNLTLSIGDQDFSIAVPVSNKKLNPTKGDVIEPVRVLPIADIEPMQSMLVASPAEPLKFALRINARKAISEAQLMVYQGKQLVYENKINGQSKEEQRVLSIEIPYKDLKLTKSQSELKYVLKVNDQLFDKTLKLIQYDHLPTLQYFESAKSTLVVKDWKTKVKHIGYITGAGDKVADVLSQFGFEVTILSTTELSNPSALAKFDAIVFGVRAANVRKDIQQYLPNIWAYIAQGGNVLMQYNTSMGLELPQFSPLPITLSRDRVTDENAAVTFLNPADPVLQTPNKITQKDFEGWVQERGIYYPASWDEKYTSVLSMNDEGENPLKSGILYAPYGKGHFVYSGLVFFRQLPAGNVGAIRLFINLLNVGK